MNKSRLLLVALLATAVGCQKRVSRYESSLGDERSEIVVAIIIDLSPSFEQRMAEDGAAYDFLMTILDRYFRDHAVDGRLLLSQISDADNALLWEGTPQQLRAEFSPETFRVFLKSKANPTGSRVHASLLSTLDYLNELPSEKAALFVLSDFVDTNDASTEMGQKIKAALARFAKRHSVVGFYYMDQQRLAPWRNMLTTAGIKDFRVKPAIAKPDLPSFDE